ncbi:hypothetical protein Hypma_008543 [Hypsizygus marmoreus]|uniref:Uncharacterized protein n=1 Tax=Hypsizygus marmoreus TaxID=39966 RepID=A0A369JQJ9_HYPMA|nr:hypothetical protein Hypma_008543 [Hypsizygus marmoreus]
MAGDVICDCARCYLKPLLLRYLNPKTAQKHQQRYGPGLYTVDETPQAAVPEHPPAQQLYDDLPFEPDMALHNEQLENCTMTREDALLMEGFF